MFQDQRLKTLEQLIAALQQPKKGLFDTPSDPQTVERQKSGIFRKVRK
jgi:hypothetical protein